MLPSLNLGGGVGAGGSSPKRILPPPRFRPARNVSAAGLLPLTTVNTGCSGAQKQGLRYEAKVFDLLENTFPEHFMPNPWLWFRDSRGYRRCQPDAFLFFPGRTVIIEVKYSHTALAWWQLRKLYEPVCEVLFPSRRIELVEVTRMHDPFVEIPEPTSLLQSLFDLNSPSPDSHLRIFSWKP